MLLVRVSPLWRASFCSALPPQILASYRECSVGGDGSDPYLIHLPSPQRKTPEKTLFLGDCHLGGNRSPQAVMNDHCYHLMKTPYLQALF